MRILGIDCGNSSVKAVEVDSAFGRFEIHDYHEVPFKEDLGPTPAIEELIRSLRKPPDKIIVPLRTEFVTFRNLQLPTKEKKAIQAAVGFELEDELPFSMEETLFDYAVLQQNKQGSLVHVTASLKNHVATTLQIWKDAHVDPDYIVPESWVYRSLLNRVLVNADPISPMLLAHIGRKRSVFYLHWRGAPCIVREITWGGQNVTDAITKKFGVSPIQAEAVKLDRGTLAEPTEEAPLAAEQLELSACIRTSMEDFFLELRQMGLMSKTLAHHNINTIYLVGGGSLLAGIGPWLEQKMHTPVKPLLALSSTSTSGVTYSEETDAKFTLALALSLSIVGPERSVCINFRQNEFKKEGATSGLSLSSIKKPLMYLGTIGACLFLSLVIQSHVYKSRLAKTNVLLEKSVKSFFGQISNSALKTYISNTKELRSSIDRELGKQRQRDKLFSPNLYSPLVFLNSISNHIPKDVVVDLSQFQVGDDVSSSASLTFVVASPQVAERLGSLMERSLNNLQKGKLEEFAPADGSPKKWKITLSGNPSENAYARFN